MTQYLQKPIPRGAPSTPHPGLPPETLVNRVSNAPEGRERTSYPVDVPLLHVLNSISEEVFKTINSQEALVFQSGDRCQITNPFTPQGCNPAMVAVWKKSPTFPQID
ncbi:hypothetical protein FRC11_012329, partial [Ceratobasidium sp. 423]